MWTWIALLVLLLLVLGYYQLQEIIRHLKSIDEKVALTIKRQVQDGNTLDKIVRTLQLKFKRVSDDFSEARLEELLRSGTWFDAIKYRREMSTDSLDEAFNFVGKTAKRIGVSMPGDKSSESQDILA